MERIRISTLAKSLGTSTTTVYKHMKRLDARLSAHITKEGGVTFITTEGAGILKASIQATTVNPALPVAVPVPVPVPAAVDLAPVVNRLESMEKAFLIMAEEIRSLKQESAALRMRLEPPPLPQDFFKSIKSVEVWKPEMPADPLAGMSFIEKVWVKVFEPQRMRKFSS